MPKNQRYLLLFLLALACHATAEEVIEFSVPAHKSEAVVSGQLTSGSIVSCRFAIERIRAQKWYPYLEIMFYSSNAVDGDRFKEYVALVAYRSFANNVLGGSPHWHYQLGILGDDYRNYEQVASEKGSEAVHTLTLALQSDSTVLYLTGDDPEQASSVEIPGMMLDQWQALAAGLKGRVICKEKVKSSLGATVTSPQDGEAATLSVPQPLTPTENASAEAPGPETLTPTPD